MLRNLQRAYDERDYETVAVSLPRAQATSSRHWPRPSTVTGRLYMSAGGHARPARLVGVAGLDGR
jgi:hypothetical protein